MSRREVAERVHGEVVGQPVVARPMQRPDGGPVVPPQPPVVIYVPVERPAEAAAEPVVRWDRVAAYIFGIAMLAVVLAVLWYGGFLHLDALLPHASPPSGPPPDLVNPSR